MKNLKRESEWNSDYKRMKRVKRVVKKESTLAGYPISELIKMGILKPVGASSDARSFQDVERLERYNGCEL